jgi:hypothetical protein
VKFPSWWSWRERAAYVLGRVFWPCWYIAPKSSRDRWAAGAALMDEPDYSHERAVELLQAHGIDPYA